MGSIGDKYSSIATREVFDKSKSQRSTILKGKSLQDDKSMVIDMIQWEGLVQWKK